MTNEWSSSREERALDPCLEKNKLFRNVSLIELLNVVMMPSKKKNSIWRDIVPNRGGGGKQKLQNVPT